jgi:hypothetical protein
MHAADLGLKVDRLIKDLRRDLADWMAKGLASAWNSWLAKKKRCLSSVVPLAA